MSDVEVSVITAVYNAAPYLQRTLDSVQAQGVGLEHILVDDGSTDGSSALLRRYARRPRVRVIHQRNRGPSYARNRALSLARGRFVINVDADDTLAPDALARKLQVMRERPSADVVMANMYFGPEEDQVLGTSFDGELFRAMRASPYEQAKFFARDFQSIPDNQPFWRAGTLKRLKYRHVRGEDLALVVSAFIHGCVIAYVDQHTGFYRTHQQSISQQGGYERLFPGRGHHHRDWAMCHRAALQRRVIVEDAIPVVSRSLFRSVSNPALFGQLARGSELKALTLEPPAVAVLQRCDGVTPVRRLTVSRVSTAQRDRILFDLFVNRVIDLRR
jgi:glycosyltransferase involved in cell wall biosynthesis